MARVSVLSDVVKRLKANVQAFDNLSPVSRIAVYVKAGSRYEPDEVPGISHYMRACAGLTTKDSSIFRIARMTERAGASFTCTSDREFIVYRIQCLRDKTNEMLGYVDDTLHKPELRSWELVDHVRGRAKEDLKRFKKNQALVTNEALHKAAFRGGLAHSMFMPEHQVETIKNNHLFEFLEKNYVLERMSFVGLAIEEEELRGIVEEGFSLNGSPYKGVVGASRYVGGGEARVQAPFPHTMVNFVVQGSPIADPKTIAVLDVFGSILGGYHQKYMKYGSGPAKSLGNLLQSLSPSIRSTLININYSDTGLFGFSLVGPNEVMRSATQNAVQHVKTVLSSIDEKDLKQAKSSLRARALISTENQDMAFESMARRFANGVTSGQTPIEFVDKLTLKDVQSVASNLLKSKPSMAAVGNPRYVPYIDELN